MPARIMSLCGISHMYECDLSVKFNCQNDRYAELVFKFLGSR